MNYMFNIVGFWVSNYCNYKDHSYGYDSLSNMTNIRPTINMMYNFIQHIVLSLGNTSRRLTVEQSYNVDNSDS